MTNLEKLQAWVKERQRTHGLEEISFFPGGNREISVEDAAGIALALLDERNPGVEATES